MSYKIEPIWQACCEQLKTILSDDIYDRWIAVIQPLSIEENNLQLAVANDFYKDWLEENYLPLIDKALILIGHEELTATARQPPRISLSFHQKFRWSISTLVSIFLNLL
mgnify:CR=1 FL=1